MSLPFLIADESSCDNYYMAARDIGRRVACPQVIVSAGYVGFCLFSADWPYEVSLVIWSMRRPVKSYAA